MKQGKVIYTCNYSGDIKIQLQSHCMPVYVMMTEEGKVAF